jgi:hypothetical protein
MGLDTTVELVPPNPEPAPGETDPAEESEIRAKDGVTDCAYVAAGIIDPSEVRDRLAKDPNSGYQGLDTDAVIVPPAEPTGETDPAAILENAA